METKHLLEVCVDSLESALAAERGGADRLELCGNLVIGGTTPSPGLFREIKAAVGIKIHILIRPRFGDFCYSDSEFRIMLEEVKMFKEMGADGIVIGILKPDGMLDMERMAALIEAAEGMNLTLHRAFDVGRDPIELLRQAKQLGIRTILTSGQEDHCLAGKELLKTLCQEAGQEIDIMVGSGVNADVIREIYSMVPARAFHMSGKETVESAMEYRSETVHMGLFELSEYVLWRTSEDEVAKAAEALREM